MGPNPREEETTDGLREELITEKGEPKRLVGLLEADLLGSCEDMACWQPSQENDVPSQSENDTADIHCKKMSINLFFP